MHIFNEAQWRTLYATHRLSRAIPYQKWNNCGQYCGSYRRTQICLQTNRRTDGRTRQTDGQGETNITPSLRQIWSGDCLWNLLGYARIIIIINKVDEVIVFSRVSFEIRHYDMRCSNWRHVKRVSFSRCHSHLMICRVNYTAADDVYQAGARVLHK